MSEPEPRWPWNSRPAIAALVELVAHIENGLADDPKIQRRLELDGIKWVEGDNLRAYVEWTHQGLKMKDRTIHPDTLLVWLPLSEPTGLDATTWLLCQQLNKKYQTIPPVCFFDGADYTA